MSRIDGADGRPHSRAGRAGGGVWRGRARYGPFLFQYSYYQPTEGLLEQALPIEGSTYAEAYHILTLGMTFDAITKLAFR